MDTRTVVAVLICVSSMLASCSRDSAPASRVFEPGPAIRSQCEADHGGFPAAFCEPLRAAVAQLRAQSRDESWAAEMENHIDEVFRADGRYWAEIRALDCRRTMCAVEFAQDVDGGPTLNEMAFVRLLQWLEPTTGGMGFEISPSSSRHKVVSVMVWTKKHTEQVD